MKPEIEILIAIILNRAIERVNDMRLKRKEK
jgi:hypothetical protein